MPTPIVPPSAKPAASASELQGGADDAEPESRPLATDDHQRVARAGAEPGTEVQRRADPDQHHRHSQQPDPDTERRLGKAVDRADRSAEIAAARPALPSADVLATTYVATCLVSPTSALSPVKRAFASWYSTTGAGLETSRNDAT